MQLDGTHLSIASTTSTSWEVGTSCATSEPNQENLDSRILILDPWGTLRAFEICFSLPFRGLACTCLTFTLTGFNVQRFLLHIQCCPLTADTSWVPFSTLFTSIYMPFTWIKSRHCVFTQSITCSLLTFRHKSHFLSIKSRAAGRDGVGPERLREFSANDAFGRLLRSIIPNDDWHRCNKSRIFKDFISKWRPACSVFRKCLSSVNNKSNFQPIFSPHPFSKAGQINDILTDIFSTSEVRQFDVLKWLGNDPNLNANVFHKKQPNLTAVS